MEENTLRKDVSSVWAERGRNDKKVLSVLDKCINQTAGSKNWSNLSMFISKAANINSSDRSKVMAIVRAAFGDQITYKKDPEHPTGGKIKPRDGLDWADVQLLNSYGVVREGLERVVKDKPAPIGFRDADLHKKLKDQQGNPTPAVADVEKSAKHIVKYLSGLKGVKPGLILYEVEKLLKAEAAKAAPVVLDKDGEPNH